MNCFDTQLCSSFGESKEDTWEKSNRIECSTCKRRFNEDVFERHSSICQKNASKPKRIYDSQSKRTAALKELNGSLPNLKKSVKKTEEIKEIEIDGAEKIDKDRFRCNGCMRKFNEKAAERHVPLCLQKIQIKTPKVVENQKILEMRKKRMHYGRNKSLRKITVESPEKTKIRMNQEDRINVSLKDKKVKESLILSKNIRNEIKSKSKTNFESKEAKNAVLENSFDDENDMYKNIHRKEIEKKYKRKMPGFKLDDSKYKDSVKDKYSGGDLTVKKRFTNIKKTISENINKDENINRDEKTDNSMGLEDYCDKEMIRTFQDIANEISGIHDTCEKKLRYLNVKKEENSKFERKRCSVCPFQLKDNNAKFCSQCGNILKIVCEESF